MEPGRLDMATAANMMAAPDSEAGLTVQRFLKTYSHGSEVASRRNARHLSAACRFLTDNSGG